MSIEKLIFGLANYLPRKHAKYHVAWVTQRR
jgi:hypothetical protein